MDSTQNQGEQATNPGLQGNVGQPNSTDLQRIKDEILREIIDDPRYVQSVKDKALAGVLKDKSLKDIYRDFQVMQQQGMSEKEIELFTKMQDMEDKLSRLQSNNPGKVVESAPKTDVGSMLVKALDLDASNADVLKALTASTTDEQVRMLSEIASRKQQSVSPALAAQPAGDGARQPDLLAEYKAKAQYLTAGALIDLKLEYQAKGLEIY